jgi:hypothetical protein
MAQGGAWRSTCELSFPGPSTAAIVYDTRGRVRALTQREGAQARATGSAYAPEGCQRRGHVLPPSQRRYGGQAAPQISLR